MSSGASISDAAPKYAPGAELGFGRWALRPAERALCLDGLPVTLGGRAFDLLLALAEGRDSVISRAELMDRVWPDVFVEENNLAVQVSALRKLLGAAAIATVPGRGYKLTLLSSFPSLPASPPAGATVWAPTLSAGGCRPLPLRPTALLGRDDDLSALQQLMDDRRLITLRGAGGIGKSSLALAAAHARRAQHPDAVAWIELAAVSDDAGIAAALCGALRLPVPGGADPWPALIEALRPQALLLVVDNAEHLAVLLAGRVAALLAQAPQVRLLVTSQVALKVDGEQVMPLAPLALPVTDADFTDSAGCDLAGRSGAVMLFVEQARAADRGFRLTPDNATQVVAICARLDGVPLALKLAAARLPLLGLAGLLAALDDRLKLLAGGPRDAPDRQRTVAAALAWSCSLLEPASLTLFCRLGVFSGGFSLPMAVALGCDAGDDALDVVERLAALVDRSLVDVTPGEPPRYRLLQSARDHALQQLAGRGERAAVERRHAVVVTEWADAEEAASWRRGDAASAAAALDDLDNLRAALDTHARNAHADDNQAAAVTLWGASAGLFMQLGLDHEARRRCPAPPSADSEGASLIDAHDWPRYSPRSWPRYWRLRGRLQWNRDHVAAHADALRAAAQYRRLGEAQGLYLALCLAAAAGRGRDNSEGGNERESEGEALLTEAATLERPDWPPRLRHDRPWARIYVCKRADDSAGALAAAEAAGALAHVAGADQLYWQSRAAVVSSLLALRRVDEAVAVARATHQGQPSRHGRAYITALGSLYAALLMQGRAEEVRPLVRRFLAESRRCNWEVLPRAADWCALLAAQEGRLTAAAALLAHADRVTARRGGRERHETLACERVLALLRSGLTAEEINVAMAIGQTLNEEDMCALALADP